MTIGRSTETEAYRKVTGQRRHVTVLFSDVSGSSEHAERLEAEEYAELLEKFRYFARDIIPRHGGSIARLQGDGVLALFGFIESREDDGRRAVEAALQLHAAAAGLQVGKGANATQMMLHSGIHAGLVLLIEGDIERGRFDVVGEVPNTASRLCSLAKAGEIMVSEETLGPQAHFFHVSLPQRLSIRGRSTDASVVRVEGRATVERRIDAAARRGVVPFIGRSAFLAVLASAAEKTKLGGAAAVIIIGEAGIGKTRMITEFQRNLKEECFLVIQGYCENYLGAAPLQPFMQAIRGALGWRAGYSLADNDSAVVSALRIFGEECVAEFFPLINAFLYGRSGPNAASIATSQLSTIVRVITFLAKKKTLVLILDDWQWADDASRQVLDALAVDQLPILILLACRPGGDEIHALSNAQFLRLEPFALSETEAAIAAWLPESDPFICQEIIRQSGGSPLFVEELCHAAIAGGDFPAIPRGAGVAWLNALVASRLARLPEAQAECLRVASVAGNVFRVSQLVHIVDPVPLLEALVAEDFLVSTEQPATLRFKHALTREAVYATVDSERRRAIHRKIAELLRALLDEGREAPDSLEALSYHFNAAGMHEQAADFAEAAGDKALGVMALDRGRMQYTTALQALDALPYLTNAMRIRWCTIAQKLGQTCVFDALDVSHGLVLFERAAQLARVVGDANTIARAEYWLGYVNYGKGRPRFAVKHCEAALAYALDSDDQRLVAQVRATLGQSLASAGRYREALPLLDHAVTSKRQQSRPGSGTAIGSAYTLARKAYTLGDLGRFDEAHATFEESLQLLGDNPHAVRASIAELICAVHLWQGRWDEAHKAGLEGADIAMRCRSHFNTAMGRALGACASWARDGDLASLQTLRESTHWIEARGGAVSTSLNYGWLVEAAVSHGLYDEARLHAAKLFARARAHDRHGEAQGCRALARLASQQGETKRAKKYLAAADRAASFRASPREQAVNRLAQAEFAITAGQFGAVAELLETTGQAFESMGMTWHLGQAKALLQFF